MNDHDRIDEAQWQAQERAFLAAGRGDPEASAADLRIARALRAAPPPSLPAGFAERLAAMARAQAEASTLLEQRLLRGLGLVFALSAAVVVAWFGRGWAAELAAVLPGGRDAVGWSAAAALCVLANWGFGALRRQFEASGPRFPRRGDSRL